MSHTKSTAADRAAAKTGKSRKRKVEMKKGKRKFNVYLFGKPENAETKEHTL